MRRLLRFLPLAIALLAYAQPAEADSDLLITAPVDYWVTFTEPTLFTAQTAQDGQTGSDPHLWLYDATGTLIAANDDYYSLQSYLHLELQAGTYRLRAGRCCGDPDRQLWPGETYRLTFTGVAIAEPTTTSTSPETTSTTSTSTSSTTTTVEPTTTTSEVETWPPTVAPTTSTTPPTSVPSTTSSSAPPDSVPPTSSTTTEPATCASCATSSTSSSTSTTSSSTSSSTTSSTTIVSTPGTTLAPTTVPNTTAPATTDEAAQLAQLDVADLQNLTADQIDELVAQIESAELTDEQAAQLAETLSDAPQAVKEAFEDAVNVFGGQFDAYVPVDSRVNVGQRRTLTAATAASSLLPGPVAVARKKKE